MEQGARSGLVRTIGRWSLAALMVNSIIGSGIFGLPSIVSRQVGPAAPIAWLLAGAFNAIIMGCFAEVASRFNQTGGPYLYARAAFGRFMGIWMGWLAWLVRLASAAASANVFIIYLAEFWGGAKDFLPRLLLLSALIGVIAVVNFRGVKLGTQVSNVFTAAKLLPLAVFIIGGGLFLLSHHRPVEIGLGHPGATWMQTMLLLVFAYGGFEGALMPMGEAKDPRRDAPFALLAGLLTCTVIYTLVQVVVMGVLPDPTQGDRPLAAAAHFFLGNAGAAFITAGALVAIFGYEASMMLNVPRLTFALAERGDFPPIFGAVHRKFRTPYVSIVVFGVLVWALALWGSFQWNAILSAVARLFYYAVVCAALPVLRRRQPGESAFSLPGGPGLAVLGVGLCLALVAAIQRSAFIILAVIAIVALLNWLWASRRRASTPDTSA
jgi:APA family basic amino acid/polyamine antiporter